jgi:hypothetical protein
MAYSPVKAWPVMNLKSVDMVARVAFAVWVVPSSLERKGLQKFESSLSFRVSAASA